jgi:hypothetical protein
MKSKQQHLATVVLAVLLCVAAVGRSDEPKGARHLGIDVM